MTEIESTISHSIATEFTATPGPRFISQGVLSGEAFRKEFLEKWFLDARSKGLKLLIDLDGGYGYAPSFLEEAFGGLARDQGISKVLETLEVKSDDQPLLRERVKNYIIESAAKKL